MSNKNINDNNRIYKKTKVSKRELDNFNLSTHLIDFLWNEPFYSRILRSLNKVETDEIPTAGVAVVDEEITLWWNRSFLAGLTKSKLKGLLKHECLHLVFGHTTDRRKEPHLIWNYATDLAINSTIPDISKLNIEPITKSFPDGWYEQIIWENIIRVNSKGQIIE